MGIIRSAIVVVSIMALVMLVPSVLSIGVYLVAGAIMAIFIFGLVVGIYEAIKLLPRTRRVENNNEKAIKSLVDDIDKAYETLIIVGGTANPKVYNDVRVKDAFKNATQRGVKIQTVFSFTGADLDKADNTIIKLAKKGMVELYIPNGDKVPRNHFRVMDKISVYSEKGHAVGQEHRSSERFDNIYNIAIRFEKAFNDIIRNSEMVYTNQEHT